MANLWSITLLHFIVGSSPSPIRDGEACTSLCIETKCLTKWSPSWLLFTQLCVRHISSQTNTKQSSVKWKTIYTFSSSAADGLLCNTDSRVRDLSSDNGCDSHSAGYGRGDHRQEDGGGAASGEVGPVVAGEGETTDVMGWDTFSNGQQVERKIASCK